MNNFLPRRSQQFWPLLLLASATVFAQFKASTELVVVDALVQNKKNGGPAGALSAADFQIYEDNARQTITQFSRDAVPLSIVFLFDMTESVRPVLKPLAAGALGALAHLKPEDEIAVMLYAHHTQVIQQFTRDHAAVAHAMESAPDRCGGEPDLCNEAAYFNEGVFQAATLAREKSNPNNRTVIIWLTDNVPNIPGNDVHSEAQALDLMRESGIVICSLLEKSAMSHAFEVTYTKNPLFAPLRMGHAPGNVHRYADESGGVVMGAHRDEIAAKLADLIDRLRSRYTIGYRPLAQKPAGTLCKIDVKLAREALKREGPVEIRARRGYRR